MRPDPSDTVILGAMNFGDTVELHTAADILDTALEFGVSQVDTANVYAAGESERIVGRLLARRAGHVTVATKIGLPVPDIRGHSPLSRAGMQLAIEASLRRLRTDYIDLLYLHRPDPGVDPQETIDTLSDLFTANTVGAWGLANYSVPEVIALSALAAKSDIPAPAMVQRLYNILVRQSVEQEYASQRVADPPLAAYNPLCGGLLTGQYSFGVPPFRGRFGQSSIAGLYRRRYWRRELFESMRQLSILAAANGVPLSELALRWLVARPLATRVVLGASAVDHVAANVSALEHGPLDADLMDACDTVATSNSTFLA